MWERRQVKWKKPYADSLARLTPPSAQLIFYAHTGRRDRPSLPYFAYLMQVPVPRTLHNSPRGCGMKLCRNAL